MAFTQKLDARGLEFFKSVANEPFSKQAVHFLNAYWKEVGDQADFIFTCAWEVVKYADMHSKGVSLIHLYNEGNDMDFNIGLYFYEKLCQKVLESEEGKKWRNDPKYKPSMPEMLTALVRKQELREKVDVDFDGRISFLEYLLYQYRAFCNPADFVERSMRAALLEETEAIKAARVALDEVNAAIRAYEEERSRLEHDAQLPGVKGLAAKNLLAQLLSSPLAERLSVALIKAEAAVRLATKQAEKEQAESNKGKPTGGTMFWMNRELEERKRLYGRKG
jgi:hypothetical protein